jgi:multicomponent K+:H+ antiporter subunit A
VAVGGLAIAAALFPQVAAGEVVRAEFAWLPAKGLDFVLRVDGLARVFALLVLVIGLLVVLYAR